MVPDCSRLVLHADDLGMNRAVNEGILRGFRAGLLTSTSLLANALDAEWAIEQWNRLADQRAAGRLPSTAVRQELGDPDCPFDLGVHLNLTQGRPLTGSRFPAELLDQQGRFLGVFALFTRLRRCGQRIQTPIRAELERQVQFLCDRGLRPTHLNGHQYIEMFPAVSAIVLDLMQRFGIGAVRVAREPSLFRTTVLHGFRVWKWPLAQVKRHFAQRFCKLADSRAAAHPDAFYGTAYAGGVNLRLLRLFLASGRKQGNLSNSVPLLGTSSAERKPVSEHCLCQAVAHHDEKCGHVEIALHPGEAAVGVSSEQVAAGWRNPLAAHRPGELRMLVSPELPALLESSGWRLGRVMYSSRSA